MLALVARLPLKSLAIALRVCEPKVVKAVFHCRVKGGLSTSDPKFALSSWNCTPATPTSSDAAAVTAATPATLEPSVGDVMETVGGVVSGGRDEPEMGVLMSTWISDFERARL